MKEYESIQSIFPTSADWSDTSLMANPARWTSGLPEGASDKVTLAGFGQKQSENELFTEEKPSVMFFSSPFPAKFSLQIPNSDETATAVPSVLISWAAAVARFHLVGVGTAGWMSEISKLKSA